MKHVFLPLALGTAVAFGGPARQSYADQPPPFADFSAKFVKPPKAGNRAGAKIKINRPEATVPAAGVQPVVAAPSGSINRPKSGQYEWFWSEVSPKPRNRGRVGLSWR